MPSAIDKSVLAFPEPRRLRDKDHLKFVSTQRCLICERQPADAHHIRFAQLRALGRKVSDEFTVPLCRAKRKKGDSSGADADIAAAKTIEAKIGDDFARYGVQ